MAVPDVALFVMGLAGIIPNFVMAAFQLCQKALRNKRSLFLLHQAAVNTVLSLVTLTMSFNRSGKACGYFGTMYVTFLTVSLYNIAAGAACEAYYFEEHCRQRLVGEYMSWPCVLLGISLVWLLAIIVHLGVTLIGASDYTLFYHANSTRCLIVQRSDRGYILSTMWILSITLALSLACLYVRRLIRELQDARKNDPKMILCSLGCQASRDLLPYATRLQQITQRTKAYILFLICFTASTSPLFLALILDRRFYLPEALISYLGAAAYLHVILMPTLFILLMKNVIWKLPYDPIKQYYDRIGNRFHNTRLPRKIYSDFPQLVPG